MQKIKKLIPVVLAVIALIWAWQSGDLSKKEDSGFTKNPSKSGVSKKKTPSLTTRDSRQKKLPSQSRAVGIDSKKGLFSFEQQFDAKKSKVWLEVKVVVKKLLPDDNKGDRHQRFLVEGASGITVLVAHNIDIAERISIRENEVIEIRGRYEWNDKGGVLHWTHHDPSGRKQGGWIQSEKQRVE